MEKTSRPALCSVENGIATVTLNRPDKRNALTRELLEALLQTFDEVESDPSVRVTIIRGGGDAFCAGMDLAEILTMRDARGWFDYELLPNVLERVAAVRHPTIAVVTGAAIAGGCELALHCDIRIGTPDARFAMPLARLGMVAPAYAIRRLIDSVGVSATRDLLLSADVVDAEYALRVGLLGRLVGPGEIAEAVDRLARQIASLAPLALCEMKRAIRDLSPDVSSERTASLDCARLDVSRSDDLREGLSAFLERRRPMFRGV